MNIISITVRFKRSRQPAPYEAAEAEVTLGAGFDEGENTAGKAEALLDDAAAAVYARLGIADPKNSSRAADKAANQELKEEAPKKRGRPPKAKDEPQVDIEDAIENAVASEPAAEEPAVEAKPISDKDLQDACAARAKAVGAAKVKALLTEFGVVRSAEMPQDKRAEFIAALEKLTA